MTCVGASARAGAARPSHALGGAAQVDPTFFLKYERIEVGSPVYQEESMDDNERSAWALRALAPVRAWTRRHR